MAALNTGPAEIFIFMDNQRRDLSINAVIDIYQTVYTFFIQWLAPFLVSITVLPEQLVPTGIGIIV